MSCNLCTNKASRWRYCYVCNQRWCRACNEKIMGNATLHPQLFRMHYKCPYCRNVFVLHSRFLTPVKKTSRACVIQ